MREAKKTWERVWAWLRINSLDISLWVLFAASALLMLKSSTDPRPDWINGTSLESFFKPFPTGNQVTFDITVGIIVSLFVYVLVVRLPERSKRRRVRASFIRQYSDFKRTCIMNFLFACNGSANMDLRDALMDRKYFREFFKESVSDSQDRWHAVLNGLDEYMVESLLQAMDLFGRELEYVVNVIEVRDPKTFESLRGVIQILHGSRRWADKNDQLKQLSQFLWQVHTGWNWVEGYTDKDFLADLVKAV